MSRASAQLDCLPVTEPLAGRWYVIVDAEDVPHSWHRDAAEAQHKAAVLPRTYPIGAPYRVVLADVCAATEAESDKHNAATA